MIQPEPYLSPEHRHMLEIESSITTGVIKQRGYWTCTDPTQLLAMGYSKNQSQVPALVVPSWNAHGIQAGVQIRADNPLPNRPKYESIYGKPPIVDIHPAGLLMAGNPAIEAWITEGIKTGDSATSRGLFVITLSGVFGFRGRNLMGGITALSDWEVIAIKGRVFNIAFDNDVMVKREVRVALKRLATFLKAKGAKDIRPILIPSPDPQTKLGLDDFFAAGGSVDVLAGCVNPNLLLEDGIIVNGRDLHEVSQDALQSIEEANEPPTLFVRAGELARVVEDERGVPKIEGMGESSFRGVLGRSASYLRMNKREGPTKVFPPKEVVQDILSLGHWPDIPPIINITRAPVLAPNGKLSIHPGYCPDSHFYIATKDPVPDWDGSVQDAVDFVLRDMLCDFPFADEASSAHALALMLLPIVRPIIDGPTPLHLFGAHTPGSGKSKLATVCLMPACGNYIATTAAGRDEEEWRKKISTALLAGRPYIFLDNLSRKLDSDSLAKGLTDMEWNDRMISTFRDITIPVRCAWVATANNVELSIDILRRSLYCHIDPKLENPEERSAFRHDPITVWVAQNRMRIVSALCKMIQTWLDEGRPEYNGSRIGSYEEWSKTIGGILSVCKVDGFLSNRKELKELANSEEAAWAEFYGKWYEKFYGVPVKPSQLLEMFCEDDELAGLVARGREEGGKRSVLGGLIKKRVGMVCGGMRIEKLDSRTGGSNSYRITKTPVQPAELTLASGGLVAKSGGSVGVENEPPLANPDSNMDEKQPKVGVSGGLDSTYAHAPAHDAHAHVRGAGSAPQTPTSNLEEPPTPTPNPHLKGRVTL